MNNHKTDNSFINEKVKLRIDNLPDKKNIKVLDCFSGDGKIWDIVRSKTKKDIDVMSIDSKKKDRVYIQTDNIKILTSLDLENFDIIDLDAYGIPFAQVEILFKRLYKGKVFVTMCQSMFGALPKKLLYSVGYRKTMIEKIPSLFYRNGFEKFCNYLATRGIKKVQVYQTPDERKNYIYYQKN